MSRRLSISSSSSNSFANFHSPSLTKFDPFQKSFLKSSLRKSSYVNSLEDIPSMSCFESDVFLKAYNNAKRKTVVISSALDDNIRGCIRKSIRNGRLRCTPGLINEALSPLLTKIDEYEALQGRTPSTLMKKKTSTSSLNLSPTAKPRFGSLLSKDGQYALLKSYEDIIVTELQSLYPEFKNLLTRTKTAKKGESEDGLNSIRRSSNASDSSDGSSYKSLFSSSRRASNESTSNYSSSRRASNESTSSENGMVPSDYSLYDPQKLRYSLVPSTASSAYLDIDDINNNNNSINNTFNDAVDYEKKVKISQKLENAMELIDNLKLIKASKEKNLKKNSILNENPVDSVTKYNEWRNEWTELIDMN